LTAIACIIALAYPATASASPFDFFGYNSGFEPAPKPRKRVQPAYHPVAEPFGKIPKGQIQIIISIDEQKLHLYSDGTEITDTLVATGVPEHPTPTGAFSIIQKSVYHESNIYSGAPMPFMQRITWSGVAMHEGHNLGHPASHGCVRLSHDFATRLYGVTRLGARVIIARPELRPEEFADPHLFVHKDKPAAASITEPAPTKNIKTAQSASDGKLTDVPMQTKRVSDIATVPLRDGIDLPKALADKPPAAKIPADKADSTTTTGPASQTANQTAHAPTCEPKIGSADAAAATKATDAAPADKATDAAPADKPADATPADKASADKTVPDQAASDKTAAATKEATAAANVPSADPAPPAQTPPAEKAADATPADKTSADKTSADKAAPDQTPSDRTVAVKEATATTNVPNANPAPAAIQTPPAAKPETKPQTQQPETQQPARPVIAEPSPATAPLPAPKPIDLARIPSKAPISIFVSRKDKKIFVRQDFAPLFSAPVTIADPDARFGTHVFTAMGYQADGSTLRWNVISFPGEPPKPSRAADTDRRSARVARRAGPVVKEPAFLPPPQTPQEALARIDIPQEAIDEISQLIIPGSSLTISDQGLGPETGEGTDFIVVTR
jgi:hypothetical protein